jgi:protoporphyrinogen oxidase
MCASIRRDGFVFDMGGHRLVPYRRKTHTYVCGLLPKKELLEKTRRSRIYLKGRSFYYPPRPLDLLRHFGVKTTAVCVGQGLRACWEQRVRPQPETSLLDWFLHRYGRRLTTVYFAPYSRKLWGAPLTQIAADGVPPHLADRDMGTLLREFFHGGVSGEEKIPAGRFFYPAGGIGRIAEEMTVRVEEKGGSVLLRRRVTRVISQPGGGFIVEAREGTGKKEFFGAGKIVATAPLPELVHMLHPQPRPDVLAAAASLRFRGMRFFNVMMDAPPAFSATGLTVPEERFVFFRVQEVSRWSPENVAAPKTACIFEVPCQKDSAVWKMGEEELLERVLSDMKKMRMDIRKRVARTFSVFAEHAYPFYSLGYREHLNAIYDYLLQRQDLVLAGGPGLFRSLSMERAIETGFEAAEALQYPAKIHALLRFD